MAESEAVAATPNIEVGERPGVEKAATKTEYACARMLDRKARE